MISYNFIIQWFVFTCCLYRRQAQECYCKSENCTGYIGAKSVDDEDEDDEGEYSGASTSGDELLPLPVIRAGPVKKKVADEQKRKQVAKRASTKGTRTRQKKKDELKLVELGNIFSLAMLLSYVSSFQMKFRKFSPRVHLEIATMFWSLTGIINIIFYCINPTKNSVLVHIPSQSHPKCDCRLF